jgi:hypothetical protein
VINVVTEEVRKLSEMAFSAFRSERFSIIELAGVLIKIARIGSKKKSNNGIESKYKEVFEFLELFILSCQELVNDFNGWRLSGEGRIGKSIMMESGTLFRSFWNVIV